MAEGKRPSIVAICRVPEEMASVAERLYIEYYRQCGANLTNSTDGGEGQSGNRAPKSPEHRAKLAAILRESAARRKGIPLKQEHKDKIWAAIKDRPREGGRFT